MTTTTSLPRGTRLPGLSLLAAGVLAPVSMIFHPTAQGSDALARLDSLAEISPLSRHVHLAMILCIGMLWLSLAWLSRRWPASSWAWVAVRCYGLSAVAMLGAALISGFLIGDYLQRALPALPHAEAALPAVLLAFSANQVLAGVGTLLMSAGIALWSPAMRSEPGRLASVIACYGLIAGLACLIGYATGMLRLDVHGMTFVVVAQSVWYCLLGAWAVRNATGTATTVGGDDGVRA